MNLNNLLGSVLDAITGRNQQPHGPRGGVLDASEDPWGDPADQHQGGRQAGYPGGVAPASQDPYGDPADQYQGHQVFDASQDPYGDPADQMDGQPVLDASQDPYGDPADQEPRRWR